MKYFSKILVTTAIVLSTQAVILPAQANDIDDWNASWETGKRVERDMYNYQAAQQQDTIQTGGTIEDVFVGLAMIAAGKLIYDALATPPEQNSSTD